MLKPIDVRDLFLSSQGERVLDWILYEHHVFNPDLDTPEKVALHKWGMKFLQLIGPRDDMSKVEWLKRAIHSEDKEDIDNN